MAAKFKGRAKYQVKKLTFNGFYSEFYKWYMEYFENSYEGLYFFV